MQIKQHSSARAAFWRDKRLCVLHLSPTGEQLFDEQAAQILDANAQLTWVKVRSLRVAVDLLRSEHYDAVILDAWSFVDRGHEAAIEILKHVARVPLLVSIDPGFASDESGVASDVGVAIGAVEPDFFAIGAQDVLFRGEIVFADLLHGLHAAAARRQKADQGSASQIGSLLAGVHAPLLVVGQDGFPLFANLAAERLTQRSQQQLKEFPLEVLQQVGASCEIDLLLPGGFSRLVSMEVSEITWNGEQAYLVALHDITKWRQLVVTLTASESKFRSMIEAINEPLVLLGPDHQTIYESPRVETVFGPKETREHFFGASPVGSQSSALHEALQVAFDSGEAQVVEGRGAQDEDEDWFQIELRPIVGVDGAIEAVLGIAHDVSVSEMLEARLDGLARRERWLSKEPGCLVLILDSSMKLVDVGPGVRELLEVEGTLDREPLGFLPDSGREHVIAAVRECLAGRNPDPLTLRSRLESRQWLRFQFSAQRESDKTLARLAIQDVTELVHAEREVEFVEQRVRQIATLAGDDVVVLDREMNIAWQMASVAPLQSDSGASPVALEKLLLDAQFRSRLGPLCDRVLATGERQSLLHHLENGGSAHRISWLFQMAPLIDRGGELSHVAITRMDVTDRQRREDELRDQVVMFRSMLAVSSDLLLVLEAATGRVLQQWTGQIKLSQGNAQSNPITESLLAEDMDFWLSALAQARSGSSASFRARAKAKDSATLWLDGQLIPMPDDSGHIERLMVIVRDESRYRAREDELRSKLQRLELRVAAIPDRMYEFSTDGRLQFLNSAALALFSQTELAKIRQEGLGALLQPSHRARLTAAFDQCLAGTEPVRVEFPIDTESAGRQWCQLAMSALRAADGEVIGVIAIDRDISRQKQIESQLERSRSRLEQVIDASPLYVLIHDSHGRRIYQSPSYELLAQETAANQTWRDIVVHPDDRERFLESFDALFSAPTRDQELQEWRLLGSGGLTTWVEGRSLCNVSKTGALESIVTLFYDISERKLFELRLGGRESLYRSMVEYSRDLIALIDPQANLVFENPGLQSIRSGLRLGQTLGNLAVAEDQDSLMSAFRNVVQSGQPYTAEARLASPDGSQRWYEIHMSVVSRSDEQQANVLAVFHEITHRKRIELALLQHEAQYRALAVHSNEWVMLYDSHGRLEYASPAALKGHGVEHEVALGGLGSDVHRDDLAQFKAMVDKSNSSESSSAIYRVRSQQGTYRILEARAHRLDFGNGKGKVLVTAFDITDRREDQHAITRDHLVRLPGSVIGDVSGAYSDLLGLVIGNLDMVDELDAGGLRQRDHIGKAMQAAQRAWRLNRALQRMIATGKEDPILLNLGTLISDLIPLLQLTLGMGAQLRFEPGSAEILIMTGRERLGAILMGTLARIREELQGSGERGTVHIDLQHHQLGAAQVGDLVAGDYACLSFQYCPSVSANDLSDQTGHDGDVETVPDWSIGSGGFFVGQLVHELAGAIQSSRTADGLTNHLIWLPISPTPLEVGQEHDEG